MTKIKDKRKNLKKDTQDFFDDDFEVIYEDDLDDLLKNSFIEDDDEPDDYYYDDDEFDDDEYDIDDDDYDDDDRKRSKPKSSKRKDSKKDTKKNKESDDRKDKSRKKHSVPNIVSPAAKTALTGIRLIFKTLNTILKAATLILIAVIIYLLASTFGNNCSTYGNPLLITEEKNSILVAYLGTAGILVFYEVITFFWVLMGRGKQGHNGQNQDTGRGLFSFLFIGVTSVLASILYVLIPVSPKALEGLQGALMVYGSLCKTLLPLCIVGAISCLIRRFVIR